MRRLFSGALLLTALSAQPPALWQLPSQEIRVSKGLFRIRIDGLNGNEWFKWWKYGVMNCGDFNRDGMLDYTWAASYLILSGRGYWFDRVTFHWSPTEMRISAELAPYGPGKSVHLETVLE